MSWFPDFNDENIVKGMKKVFGEDRKRINHALRVLDYAEKLLEREQADREVVIGAAILHDIGIHQAEKKYGSSAGHYQEKEGPPLARGILSELGASESYIEEVCQIIAHHHSPGKVTSHNFKVVYDADWLVNLGDEYDLSDQKRIKKLIDRIFLTKAGQELAGEIYLRS